MRALVVDPSRPLGLALAERPDPEPRRHQALVGIAAASINPSDLAHLPDAPAGAVPGFEAAGVVLRAAADGSGPAEGTPVVTLGPGGAWAERRAVDTTLLGRVPAGVDPGAAATLPVAATSALRALRALGPILGRRVLVTGATGAVGRFAVQLARLGGAEVVATVRDPGAVDELSALGAAEVATGRLDLDSSLVHGVIENVGGPQLVAAFDRLEANGTLVSVGRAGGEPATLPADALLGDGNRHGRSIVTFFLSDGTPGLGTDMTWLAARLGDGSLRTTIGTRLPWADLADPDRSPRSLAELGKVVLDVA